MDLASKSLSVHLSSFTVSNAVGKYNNVLLDTKGSYVYFCAVNTASLPQRLKEE